MTIYPVCRPNARARALLWLAIPYSLAAAGSASAAVCRVTSSGSGNGNSWSQAANLQSALANAAYGEVWVAAGTYKPTAGTDRTISFKVRPGVAVYGGFVGNEVQRNLRNPTAHLTTLSGDIGPDSSTSDNSYHVVVMDGSTGTKILGNTVLDGFTIIHGMADGNVPFYQASGGGLYCDGQGVGSECSPTLNQLNFSENAAGWGGAIFIDGLGGVSSPVLTHVTFSNNTALHYAGAMYGDGSASGISSATLSNVTFKDNTAGTSGGAMMNDGAQGTSNPTLHNVTFVGNKTNTNNGGAMFNNGYQGNSSPVLNRVTFDDNHAASLGGAIFNQGNEGVSSPLLTDVVFSNNRAALAGAIYNNGNAGTSSPTMSNVTFNDNIVTASAGAIYNDGRNDGHSSPIISNATFTGNSNPHEFGGAIYSYAGDGGESNAKLSNVTFSGNSADEGGAMYNDGRSGGDVNPVLVNVIMWGNTAPTNGPQIYNRAGTGAGVSITSSVIEGGCASIAGATCLAGNAAGNPELNILGDDGGFTQTMLPGSGSSAIDNGNAATCANSPVNGLDQRGAIRPYGSGCDIGSVEAGGVIDLIFANGFD